MTKVQILAELYRRLNFQTAPAADVTTRLLAFVNEVQQALASEPALAHLLRGSLPFATIVGQAEYGLPPPVSRVMSVRTTTSRRRLRQMSIDWYRSAVADQTAQTGSPFGYVLLGPQAVSRQPSDASELFAVSTAAGDTQALHFEVRTSDGSIRTGSVSLTGVTAVSLGVALTTIEEVLDLYLVSGPTGVVTLHEDSGIGTTLATIGIGQARSRMEGIAFVPTPSAVLTYTLDYEHDVTDLVQDTDSPIWLPARFHRLLSLGARMMEYEKAGDGRYETAQLEYTVGIQRLKAYVTNPPDYVLVPGATRGGWSDLGPDYPAGTIWD